MSPITPARAPEGLAPESRALPSPVPPLRRPKPPVPARRSHRFPPTPPDRNDARRTISRSRTTNPESGPECICEGSETKGTAGAWGTAAVRHDGERAPSGKENRKNGYQEQRKRCGGRPRGAVDRGDEHASREHDASHGRGRIVHAHAGDREAASSREVAHGRGRRQGIDPGEAGCRENRHGASAHLHGCVRGVREGGISEFA